MSCSARLLEPQQRLFHFRAAGVAARRAVRADDAVAGDDDEDGVRVICHAHRAAGVRPADGLGELFVAARFAIGYFTQRRPDPLLEGRAVQAAGKIERPARPGKILVQLTEYPCGQRVRRFPSGVGRGELQGRDRAVLPVQLHFPKRRMINGCSFHVRFSSCKTGFFSEIGAFSQC